MALPPDYHVHSMWSWDALALGGDLEQTCVLSSWVCPRSRSPSTWISRRGHWIRRRSFLPGISWKVIGTRPTA